MVYRGAKTAMSAYKHELEAGLKEGVRFVVEHQPRRIETLTNGQLQVVFDETSVQTDLVVLAIGQNKRLDVVRLFPGVERSNRGLVLVDPLTHRTTHFKVWAGGDCTNGGKEVVNAVAESKIAAASIHAFLTSLPRESAHA
jgi:glutamate synthase (NADPH/NADH) small chain